MSEVVPPVITEEKVKKQKYIQKGIFQSQLGKEIVEEENRQEPSGKQDKKEPKRPRKQRKREEDQYNYDINLVTENTQIPKLPKKNEIINKPDDKEYKNKEGEIIEKIKLAKQRRAKILSEKFERQKKNAKGQPVEKNIFNDFDIEKEEAHKLRETFMSVLNELKSRNSQVESLFDELKDVDHQINEIVKSQEGDTFQNISDKLKRYQNKLVTATLSLKEEKFLQQQIQILKRTLNSANSTQNLEAQLQKLKERKTQVKEKLDVLKAEKKNYQNQFNEIKPKLDAQNQKVNKIKQEITKLKIQKKQANDQALTERQLFYQKKTKKKQAIDNEIEKLRNSIDALWEQYSAKYDQWSKQQRFIKYIEWLTRQKNKIIRQKQFEERRRQYQERQKQRQLKQTTIKIRKYDTEIRNCAFLIDYCNRLRPEQTKEEVKVAQKISVEQINQKLGTDSQWKKQKGVTIIQSKKDRDLDIQVVSKKNKKVKKQEIPVQKVQKTQKVQKAINFDLQIINAFDTIKILPPITIDDLNKKIVEIKQKEALYLKMSEQESNNTEAKEQQKKQHQKQGKSEKKVRKEEQFPEL